MKTIDSSRYRKTKYGGLYLSYSDIEQLTEDIIMDYRSAILTEPQAVEYDDFLEGYLDANIQYQYIYSKNDNNIILGCTVFNKQRVYIFDKENMKKDYIECEPRTVILDCSLVDGNRKVQENITGLHEGGHLYIHPGQFAHDEGQMFIQGIEGIICCRKDEIEKTDTLLVYNGNSAELWREWQANVFAVTMALPKRSLDISVRELFRKYNISEEQLITDADSSNKYLAEHIIPAELKKIYNMSKESIKYRLFKTGFYTTMEKYKDAHTNIQMSVFDFIK
ncbi:MULTISPECIES: hypothetical protein [Eubacterium]|uniref:hypothetical protein n=1 Tax=Eubacterium TaxID=1730 RepID=UPI00247A6AA1|nr:MULTISPECIES: hypothetical protein [Eubacterium]MCR5368551.1 DUF4296 domain-containing protein [Eubacterium sp.]